jgi:hypothetical protein
MDDGKIHAIFSVDFLNFIGKGNKLFFRCPLGRIGNRVRFPDGPATVSRCKPGETTRMVDQSGKGWGRKL